MLTSCVIREYFHSEEIGIQYYTPSSGSYILSIFSCLIFSEPKRVEYRYLILLLTYDRVLGHTAVATFSLRSLRLYGLLQG